RRPAQRPGDPGPPGRDVRLLRTAGHGHDDRRAALRRDRPARRLVGAGAAGGAVRLLRCSAPGAGRAAVGRPRRPWACRRHRGGLNAPGTVPGMDFAPSPRAADLTARVRAFIAEHIAPVEADYHRTIRQTRESGGDAWQQLPVLAELQAKAREQGLWNLWLPHSSHEPKVREYAE